MARNHQIKYDLNSDAQFKNLANGDLSQGYFGFENILFTAQGSPISIATSQRTLDEQTSTNQNLLLAKLNSNALFSFEKKAASLEHLAELLREYGTFCLDELNDELLIVEYFEIDNEVILSSEKAQSESLVEHLNNDSKIKSQLCEFCVYTESEQYSIFSKFM